MNLTALLFDVGVPGGGATIAGVGVVFFLLLAVVTFLAYRMFRKTMKWAFRISILAAILIATLVGGGIMIWYSMKATPERKSVPTRQR